MMMPSAGTRPPGRTSTDITNAQRIERDAFDRVVVADSLCIVGQQLGQRRERAPGLADRAHLLPVAEQHDRDQGGELPPELQVEPLEARREGCAVRDDDRHRDQQHHSGLTRLHFGDATGEERPTTPEEHDRTKDRTDQTHAREVQLVAEPVHDHLGRDNDRNGQPQAQPEPATEHLRIVSGVLVVHGMIATRVVLVFGVRGRHRHRLTLALQVLFAW